MSGAYDYSPKFVFTAVAATNAITCAGHGLQVNDIIQVYTTAADLPAPLAIDTNYYVLAVTATNTFTISTSQGGSVVDITDTGTGTHTFATYNTRSRPADLRLPKDIMLNGRVNPVCNNTNIQQSGYNYLPYTEEITTGGGESWG